jgi:hypothetical protein
VQLIQVLEPELMSQLRGKKGPGRSAETGGKAVHGKLAEPGSLAEEESPGEESLEESLEEESPGIPVEEECLAARILAAGGKEAGRKAGLETVQEMTAPEMAGQGNWGNSEGR